MSFKCYAGGQLHSHDRAEEGRECYSKSGRSSAIVPTRAQSGLKAIESQVPAGHYAVVDPEDNRLKCYRVDKPSGGKWDGYTFLKVAQSDEWWNCKAREYKMRILGEIAKDVEAAGKKYAETMTRCRKCNRAIHDQDNPYYTEGYGPECGSKV